MRLGWVRFDCSYLVDLDNHEMIEKACEVIENDIWSLTNDRSLLDNIQEIPLKGAEKKRFTQPDQVILEKMPAFHGDYGGIQGQHMLKPGRAGRNGGSK